MKPKQRMKAGYRPRTLDAEYVERKPPYEVHTGSVITRHYDLAGAEAEKRYQQTRYGKVATIVQPAGQAA